MKRLAVLAALVAAVALAVFVLTGGAGQPGLPRTEPSST